MKRLFLPVLGVSAMVLPRVLLADATVLKNPPSECGAAGNACGCSSDGESGRKGDGTDGEQGANDGDGTGAGCIKAWLGLGRTTPWTGSLPCSLKVFADDDAPEIFTTESLHAVLGGYTFKRLGQRTMADGETSAEVVFSHPNGEGVTFAFAEGESWGRPDPGVHRDMDERLMMVDAGGWATLSAPAYYDLHPGDGSVWRFLATGATNERGALVSFTDPRGRVLAPADFGVDIVRDALGNVRQVKTPSRLADVQTLSPTNYAVTVYPLAADPDFDAAAGLYAVPAGVAPVRVLDVGRGASVRELLVGFRKGSGPRRLHRYEAVNGDWTLRRPDGLSDAQEVYYTPDEDGAQRLHVVRDASGRPLSRTECNYVSAYWGYLMTNRVDGLPGEVRRTQSWSYHDSGAHRDLLRETVTPTGERIQYEYDDQNRVVRETRPLSGEVATYSYAPVDPADPPLLRDMRPRLVVRTMQGIEVERTYYAYTSNRTEIVERCATPGAPYGAADSLRSVRAWNAPSVPGPGAGLPASVRREDGSLDLLAYALGDGLWTETATHVHESAPAPVPMRTTRDVAVYDARSRLVERRTELLTAPGEWTAIDRTAHTYDIEGNEIRREDLAGRVWTSVWGGACCGKTSETDWQGVTTLYAYDEEGRVTVSTRLLPDPLETHYGYDALGRVSSTFQTNRIAGIGTPPERTLHDSLGRTLSRTDARGAVTRFSYAETASGSMRTEIRADGTDLASTNTVQLLSNGRALSRSLNGALRERHAYAPLSATTYSGPGGADSLRWTRTERDLFGRVVSTASPGFGGSTLVSSNRYDTAGRLVETAEYALEVPQGGNGQSATDTLLSRTLLAYDLEGNEVLRVEDRDRDGAIDLAGADFAVSNAVSFVLHDDALWRRTGTYATVADGSPDFHFLGATETRLTGFSDIAGSAIGGAWLVSESAATDSRGNVSTSRVLVRRGDALVLRETASPTSVQPRQDVLLRGYSVTNVSSTAVTTSRAYDGLGRLSSVTDGRGNATLREYTPAGDLTRIVDAAGNATEYAHDILGRRIAETDPLGNAVHRAYDSEGHVVGEWGATYPAAYEYDAWGSRTALYTYRGTNDIASASDLLVLKPSMDRTRWLLDEATGLVTNKVYADGKGPTYSYTPAGKPLRRVWARGVATDYAYDETGTLSSIAYSDDTPSVAYARDRLGRVVRAVVEGVSTNEYAYSLSGLLTNEVQNGVILSRTYDDFSRPTGYALHDGINQGGGASPSGEPFSVTYTYDTLGRFASVASGTNVFTYTRLPGTDFVTGYSCGPFRRAVTYEPQRDLVATVTNSFGDRLISAFDYVNDPAGRRISRRDTRENEVVENVFGYNLRSELTSAQMGTNTYEYAYDPIGNRIFTVENGVRTDYAANELNQYIAVQTAGEEARKLAYDEDGNTVLDGTGWTYAWNGENRMVLASNSTICVIYDYDERGRMVQKRNVCDSMTVKSRVWDDYNIIYEITQSEVGINAAYNVWGIDIDGEQQSSGGVGGLVAVSINDKQNIPCYDSNGNIHEYISANGVVIARQAYEPFMSQTVLMGDATQFLHWFSTKPKDFVTSFVEYEFRQYYSQLGRWLSRDMVEEFELNFISSSKYARFYKYELMSQVIELLPSDNSSAEPKELFALLSSFLPQHNYDHYQEVDFPLENLTLLFGGFYDIDTQYISKNLFMMAANNLIHQFDYLGFRGRDSRWRRSIIRHNPRMSPRGSAAGDFVDLLMSMLESIYSYDRALGQGLRKCLERLPPSNPPTAVVTISAARPCRCCVIGLRTISTIEYSFTFFLFANLDEVSCDEAERRGFLVNPGTEIVTVDM